MKKRSILNNVVRQSHFNNYKGFILWRKTHLRGVSIVTGIFRAPIDKLRI